MKNLRWFGLGVLCLSAACNKAESSGAVAKEKPSSPVQEAPKTAPAAAPETPANPTAATPAKEAPVAVASETAPASFASGKKEQIDGAIGVGCEAKSSEGWLEFLCRKKNGTGGHPVRAVLNAETNEEVLADEHGELRLTLPFREGESKDVTIEWTDTRYVLHVTGASAKLEWGAATLEHRRACAKVLDESKKVLTDAQKVDAVGRVLPTEVAKFPRFGVCQAAGLGSWALALTELTGSGEGTSRSLRASLSVTRISENGTRLSVPFGMLEFAPGGLEVSGLQVYDYDDDGKNELIVAYELKAVAGTKASTPNSVWSFSDTAVVPYQKSPTLVAGGSAIEQLEFDMRPDIADYGPFITWFGADCGIKRCPERLTGPRFFYRSMPDGSFTRDDASPKAALKRACAKKPESIVVETGGTINASQTAKNLGCARAYGVATETIVAELSAKQKLLCGEAASCPLATALQSWAAATAPITL